MSGCLYRWVEEGARAAAPHKVAVASSGGELTFEALLRRARGVAAHLGALGIGRGDRVAVWMDKSPDTVAVLLGILASGAAYVAVDPRSPASRCALILADARPRALFADLPRTAQARHLTASGACVAVTPDPAVFDTPPSGLPPPDPEALAYILYTSGSTGTPKGVAHTHASALAFVHWVVRTFRITEGDVFTSHAPFHFDLSVSDLYASLGRGARVHLISHVEAMVPSWLTRRLGEWKVTVWYSVPSALVAMMEKGGLGQTPLPHLRCVLFAGEVFGPPHLHRLRALLPRVDLCNLYGPTETNVCTWQRVPREDWPQDRPLPIGVACDHMEVFALGDDGRESAVGEVGTLWSTGPNLMAGYWRADGTRAAGLKADPRGSGRLAYDTGDLVRRRPDGGFDFLGRRDHQLKTRGYRVELGEVEHAVLGDVRVSEAVACGLPDPQVGHRIAVVVVPRAGSTPTANELRNVCAERLPGYMVPERILVRDALPRTSTGKADRGALRSWFAEENEGEEAK